MSSLSQVVHLPALKKILFATDFSPNSLAAVPYLRAIADRFGSSVHAVHVLATEPMLEIPLDLPPELDADLENAQSTFKTALGKKPFGTAVYKSTVERGNLWKVLAAIIEAEHIDLIAIGTHGRRGFKKLVLGSVAEQVFRLSPCPVLTFGPQCIKDEAEHAGLATILYATDFSAGAQHALEFALSFAQANKSRLILLHAVPSLVDIVSAGEAAGAVSLEVSKEYEAESLKYARQQLEELIAHETFRELKPEIVVECGEAATTILDVAMKKHVDLIVMGAHRVPGSSLASHLPWATASAVVCQAHCPVLTVRS